MRLPSGRTEKRISSKTIGPADDIEADQVDVGFPKLISDGWPGLAASGQAFVGAFVWPQLIEGRQKAYFFHPTIYYRYDVLNDSVNPGYPKTIRGNWPGL